MESGFESLHAIFHGDLGFIILSPGFSSFSPYILTHCCIIIILHPYEYSNPIMGDERGNEVVAHRGVPP